MGSLGKIHEYIQTVGKKNTMKIQRWIVPAIPAIQEG
jgi:hypothetical protein